MNHNLTGICVLVGFLQIFIFVTDLIVGTTVCIQLNSANPPFSTALVLNARHTMTMTIAMLEYCKSVGKHVEKCRSDTKC